MNNQQQFLQLIQRQNRAVEYKRTLVAFDGDFRPYEAYVNFSDRWNGWLKPYILQHDVERVLNDSGVRWFLTSNKSIVIYNYQDSDMKCSHQIKMREDDNLTIQDTIPLEKLEGVNCYNFGNLGWVFEKYNSNR